MGYLATLSVSVWLLVVAMEPAPIVTLTVTDTGFLLLLIARWNFFAGFSVAVALSDVPHVIALEASVVAFFSPSLRAWLLATLIVTRPVKPASHAVVTFSPLLANFAVVVAGSLLSFAAVGFGCVSGSSGLVPGRAVNGRVGWLVSPVGGVPGRAGPR